MSSASAALFHSYSHLFPISALWWQSECVCSSQFSYRFKMQIFTAEAGSRTHRHRHRRRRMHASMSGAVNFCFYLPFPFNIISRFRILVPTPQQWTVSGCRAGWEAYEWNSIDKINLWKYHKQCDSGKLPIEDATFVVITGDAAAAAVVVVSSRFGFHAADELGQAPTKWQRQRGR